MLSHHLPISGWKSSKTCGLIWNPLQQQTTSNGENDLQESLLYNLVLTIRYKPFLFKSYNTVSQHFKKILEKVTQEPNVVKALTKTSVSMELDDVDDMFQQFGDAMQVWMNLGIFFTKLSSVQSFLDPKRAHCPRLYFISDKEMITMYRDASMDILATEPYIRKMFKAVHSLVLKEEPAKPVLVGDNHPPPRYNPLVVGFKSVDGEYVKFHRVMKARGQVEEWIKFLDHYIKTTLINLCRELKAKARLKNKNFEDILEDHRYPFQVLFHASANMKLFFR